MNLRQKCKKLKHENKMLRGQVYPPMLSKPMCISKVSCSVIIGAKRIMHQEEYRRVPMEYIDAHLLNQLSDELNQYAVFETYQDVYTGYYVREVRVKVAKPD